MKSEPSIVWKTIIIDCKNAPKYSRMYLVDVGLIQSGIDFV